MSNEFDNRVALIFGAARGIGAATARRLAQMGVRVVISDILEAEGHTTAEDIKSRYGPAEFVGCDVADLAQIQSAVDRTHDHFGRIDILFNNVGTVRYGQPHLLSIEDWDLTLEVNLRSQFLAAKYALPHMMAQRYGVIINTASVLAHGSQKNTVAYASSKAGVLGLTRSLAVEYAEYGIRCVSISPGTIDTPIIRQAAAAFGDDIEETIKVWGAAHPVGRVGTPDEVAALVAYLASDQAGFTTGMDYPIDGGVRAGLYN